MDKWRMRYVDVEQYNIVQKGWGPSTFLLVSNPNFTLFYVRTNKCKGDLVIDNSAKKQIDIRNISLKNNLF